MQDFFCPKCGRRMLNGSCPHCEGRVGHRSPAGSAGAGQAARARRSVSALTEEKNIPEKIVPIESLRSDRPAPERIREQKKEEIVITLVERDEQREKAEAIAKNTPWKAEGLGPAKRVSLFVSHCVSKFTSFVDGLVNPEDE